MAEEKPYYLGITVSGRPLNYGAATYWEILEKIFGEYQSAGGNWDRPHILLRDGAVVVPGKLSEHAWNYGSAKSAAIAAAVGRVQENQKPEWL